MALCLKINLINMVPRKFSILGTFEVIALLVKLIRDNCSFDKPC